MFDHVHTNDICGNVYDIQKFSVHDGPGIRTDVFLKGCPLACLWCHSPESQTFGPDLAWMDIKCMGIEKDGGLCIAACPNGAITAGEPVKSLLDDSMVTKPVIDRNKCTGCMKCTNVCPTKALFNTQKKMDLEEIIQIIAQDNSYYKKSGGGVTISGGEPMSQFPFTLALAKRCKEAGYHVALDTTGFAPWHQFAEILPYIDLFLYDLKHMDAHKSQALTGVSNVLILENALKIARAGGKFQIRFPIIPTLNDSEENIQKTAAFCMELREAIEVVQLLPYHRLGSTKYTRIGIEYPVKDIVPPSAEFMEGVCKLFQSYGLPAKIG